VGLELLCESSAQLPKHLPLRDADDPECAEI